MRLLSGLIFFFMLTTSLLAQEQAEGPDFPPYPVEKTARLKSGVTLPPKVDLSKSKYFPPVINQHGWSCNQASSIGYLLTYELNRVRNADAKLPENRYPPLYTWNFLNDARYEVGVSYFDTWEIIKAGGCPNMVDFPVENEINYWMSGYEKHYRAMQNRVINNYSLAVGTPEGVQLLKRYVFDHFDGSKFGGMANFQIASSGMAIGYLSDNSVDPGAPYIARFGSVVGHAMTIVGYNDSVKFDLNHDGRYTNDLDINNDRVVDLNDWEKGAFIVYNTWGAWLNRNGMAYVPYHVLALFGHEGGFWNRSVHIVEVVKAYQPIITMRAELYHTNRSKVRIMAGVSNDPDATEPEHILEFPMFNFQGGESPLSDFGRADGHFELGLDITPLSAHIDRGKPVRFFLIIDEKDFGDQESGRIFSVGVYNHFTGKDSVMLEGLNIPVSSNSRTVAGLVRSVDFNRVEVKKVPMIFAKAGDYVSVQMEATGAASPYRWELVYEYDETFGHSQEVTADGEIILNSTFGNLDYPFELPFDFTFYGKQYKQVLITSDAQILFEPEEMDYPYAMDTSLVFRSRKRIVPYGKPLDYYMAENAIRFLKTDSLASFTWQAMAPTEDGPEPVLIICNLFRDGRISFVYDNTKFLHGGQVPFSLGISNGDSRLFKQTTLAGKGEDVNLIWFTPARHPMETKLDATGWLFCKPEQADARYEIRILARDKYNMTGTGSVFISTMNLDSADLLRQNFPNPFYGSTTIPFIVPEKSHVTLDIHDLSGRKVATLVDQELDASEYEVVWQGKDSGGQYAGSGIYLLRLRAGERTENRKMIRINQ